MRPPRGRALATAGQRHRLHLHYAHGFATQRLARMLHSLVRVSRRVGCGHSGTNDRSARCDRPPARRAGPSTATARSDRLGCTPDRSGPAPRGGPALQRARLATLLSRPRNVQTTGYKFPTRTRGHLPRRPPGPGTTVVGRLPAEVQSCRTARLAAEQPRPDGTATTSPEPDGEPLQPHSFPS